MRHPHEARPVRRPCQAREDKVIALLPRPEAREALRPSPALGARFGVGRVQEHALARLAGVVARLARDEAARWVKGEVQNREGDVGIKWVRVEGFGRALEGLVCG